MPTVFISYKRETSASLATLIADRLRQNYNIDCFVDTRHHRPGHFPSRLHREIEDRDVFVCLIADTTFKSDWVLREIEHAHNNRKIMIPVFQDSYLNLRKKPDPPDDHVGALLENHGVEMRSAFMDAAIARLAEMITPSVETQQEDEMGEPAPLPPDLASSADDLPPTPSEESSRRRWGCLTEPWVIIAAALITVIFGLILACMKGEINPLGICCDDETKTPVTITATPTATPTDHLTPTATETPTPTATHTYTPSPTPTPLVVARFDGCSNMVELGGGAGATGLIPTYEPDDSESSCAVELDCPDECSYWIPLLGHDLTLYSRLVFDIKAGTPAPDKIKIELRRKGDEVSRTYVSGITEDWQNKQVEIGELQAVPGKTPLSSFTDMTEIVFTFETGQSGVVYLDNIVFEP